MKDISRVKQTGEVFTPSDLVKYVTDIIFESDPKSTYIDPSCGNGQFLSYVFSKTKVLGWPSTYSQLKDYREIKGELTRINKQWICENIPPKKGGIFGIDICIDNVCDTIARLILLEKEGVDYWKSDSTPSLILNHPGYENESFCILALASWELINKKKYQRCYNNIIVRHKGWMENFQNKAAYFEYKYKDEDWKNCYNIVCADALEYDYEFIPE